MAHKLKVAIIGSGNWGSAISKIIGTNVKNHPDTFEEDVNMWVFQEQVDGQNLTDIINEKHENVKYLPGIPLPENIHAVADVKETAIGANILVFVLPHQFVYRVCETLKDVISPDCKAISLIKGLDFQDNNLTLFSEEIEKILGIPCACLSGANIATEVAEEKFGETTIAAKTEEDGKIFEKLFHTPNFDVKIINDHVGVEVCGSLKNVIAIGAGICDGLDYGNNTKAAVIRRGLLEMRKFGKTFFGGVRTETFFESCGVADLITTCAGGRNRKVAAAFINSGKPIEEIEKEMLNGQKLQGTTTALEVHRFLESKNMTDEFPLMTAIYEIVYEGAPPELLAENLRTRKI
ncbi:glycerol-3-phosphate dehydrogenase [NAD+] [Phycomyces nitens]|nr:glycerol-3-phosphate dehydrogenase [NAD+] [Phycomyces nitens]